MALNIYHTNNQLINKMISLNVKIKYCSLRVNLHDVIKKLFFTFNNSKLYFYVKFLIKVCHEFSASVIQQKYYKINLYTKVMFNLILPNFMSLMWLLHKLN